MESDLLIYTNALTSKIFNRLYLALKPSVGVKKAKQEKKEKKYLRLETDSSEERLKPLPKASVEIQTESYAALYSELIEKDKEIDKLRQELLLTQLELERRLSHEKARMENEEDQNKAENRLGEYRDHGEKERRVDDDLGIEERVFVSKKHQIDEEQRRSVLDLKLENNDMEILEKDLSEDNSKAEEDKSKAEEETLEIPVRTNEIQVEKNEIPVEANEIQVENNEIPEGNNEIPVKTSEISVETQENIQKRPESAKDTNSKPQKLTKINTPHEIIVEARVIQKKTIIKPKKKTNKKLEAHPFALSDSSSGPEHPSTPVSPTNPPTPDLNSEVSSLKSYGDLAKMLENDGLVAPMDSHPFLDPVPSLPPLFPSFDASGLKIESFAFDPSFPIINKALTSKVSQPDRLINSQQSNLRSRNSSLPWTEDLEPPIDNFPQPKIKSRSTKHRPRTQEKVPPSKPDTKATKYSSISRKLPTLPTKEKYNVSKKPKSHMNMRPKAKKLINGERKRTNRVQEDALDEIIFNEAQDSETWSRLMIKFRQNPTIVERLLKKDRRPVTQEAILRDSRKPKIEERHTSGGQRNRNSESSIEEKEIWIPSIYNFPKRDP